MEEIAGEIKKEISEIRPGASEAEIKNAVKRVLRNINKATLLSGQKKPALIKIGADLSNLVSSQLSFYNMNKASVVEKFDDSFFRALEILKKELFTLLTQASDETKH